MRLTPDAQLEYTASGYFPCYSEFLDNSSIKDYCLSVITKVTGKNQITIPVEIAAKLGLRRGARLEWRLTARPDVAEVHVLPDLYSVAEALRGKGKAHKKTGSPVDRLVAERKREEEQSSSNGNQSGTTGGATR